MTSKMARRERGEVCEVCETTNPGRGGRDRRPEMEVAHLFSRVEMRGGKGHYEKWAALLLKDPENLVVMCQPCHAEMDTFLGVHGWWLKPRAFPRIYQYRHKFTELFDRRDRIMLAALEAQLA